MAESNGKPEAAANNPATDLSLTPEAQFRSVSRRLEAIETALTAIGKPPGIRLGDGLSLLGILIAVATIIFAALGLSARIDHVDGNASQIGRDINGRLDKLDERLRTLEINSAVQGAAKLPSRSR